MMTQFTDVYKYGTRRRNVDAYTLEANMRDTVNGENKYIECCVDVQNSKQCRAYMQQFPAVNLMSLLTLIKYHIYTKTSQQYQEYKANILSKFYIFIFHINIGTTNIRIIISYNIATRNCKMFFIAWFWMTNT